MSDSLQTVYEGKFLRMVKRGKWEFAQRTKVSGVVGIIAVTPERKLILVEQFRTPLNKSVVELPAGLAGDLDEHSGEALEIAANRELEEETGYRAKAMKILAAGPSSAGLSDEVVTLLLATNLERIHTGGGDGTENITVHEIELDRVHTWLEDQSRDGKAIDLKIYSALYFAKAPHQS